MSNPAMDHKARQQSQRQRILVMRYRFIGDTLLTVPFLRNLRAAYPDAKIDMLIAPNSGEVLRDCPYIDEFIVFDTTRKHRYENPDGTSQKRTFWSYVRLLRERRYDTAFVLKRSLSSAVLAFLSRIPERIGFDTEKRGFLLTTKVPYPKDKHEIDCFLEVLRAAEIPVRDRYLESWLRPEDHEKAAALLASVPEVQGKSRVSRLDAERSVHAEKQREKQAVVASMETVSDLPGTDIPVEPSDKPLLSEPDGNVEPRNKLIKDLTDSDSLLSEPQSALWMGALEGLASGVPSENYLNAADLQKVVAVSQVVSVEMTDSEDIAVQNGLDPSSRLAKGLGRPLRDVVLHLTSSNPAKQWPLEQAQSLLVWLFSRSDCRVHCLGAPSDAALYETLKVELLLEYAERVHIHCGKLDLLESMAFLQCMDLVIGVDSGTLHMAAAVNVPIVALFGPMDERKWAPPGAQILTNPLPCRPCNLATPCHHDYLCMKGLRTEAVIETIRAYAGFA